MSSIVNDESSDWSALNSPLDFFSGFPISLHMQELRDNHNICSFYLLVMTNSLVCSFVVICIIKILRYWCYRWWDDTETTSIPQYASRSTLCLPHPFHHPRPCYHLVRIQMCTHPGLSVCQLPPWWRYRTLCASCTSSQCTTRPAQLWDGMDVFGTDECLVPRKPYTVADFKRFIKQHNIPNQCVTSHVALLTAGQQVERSILQQEHDSLQNSSD